MQGEAVVRGLVTIRSSIPGDTPQQIDLDVGERARFGTCRCGGCAYDLALRQGAAGFAGEITAAAGHWLLTNLCAGQTVLVENLEDGYEYLTVEAGRALVPIPFELSRVGMAGLPRSSVLTVFGPEPARTETRARLCAAMTNRPPALNPRATYFAVLSALCESRRRGVSAAPLPTSEEIARRLGSRVSARAVDAHIEYLIGKLGLPHGCGRDVLVATAVRHRLVTG